MAEPKKAASKPAPSSSAGSTRTALLVLGIALALSAAGNLYLGSKVYSDGVGNEGAVAHPPQRDLLQQEAAPVEEAVIADAGAAAYEVEEQLQRAEEQQAELQQAELQLTEEQQVEVAQAEEQQAEEQQAEVVQAEEQQVEVVQAEEQQAEVVQAEEQQAEVAQAEVVAGDAVEQQAEVTSVPPPAPIPPILSGLGPEIPQEELKGAWQLTQEVFDHALSHPNATVIRASKPRVVLIKDFMTPEETQHLINLGLSDLHRSEVVADQKVTDQRSSYGSFLDGYKRDDVVRNIQHRIHQLVGIPEAFGEALYVLRYENGQRYDPHNDHCALGRGEAGTDHCKAFLARAGGPGCGPGAGGATCGDRLATFILYLQAPIKGGATVFPKARADGSDRPYEYSYTQDVPEYCQEDSDALKVSPPAGSAALFWDYTPSPDGNTSVAVPDDFSHHGGCPVVEGTKLITTRWIRSSEFV